VILKLKSQLKKLAFLLGADFLAMEFAMLERVYKVKNHANSNPQQETMPSSRWQECH
jgi:hypothetical protein